MRTQPLLSLTLVLAPFVFAATSASAQSESWSELTKRLPASTNAVLAIDAEAMFQSEFAVKNNWRKSHADRFDRDPTMLPPVASRFLLATNLDTEHFEPTYDFAVMSTVRPIPLSEILTRIDGELDTIGGRSAIHTKRDSYIVPIGDDHVALIRNASQEWASEQIRSGQQRSEAKIPSVLAGAIDEVAAGDAQISVGFFLGDTIPKSEVPGLVQRFESLREAESTSDKFVDEMASLEGFILSIQISDTIHGQLKMTFGKKPEALSTVAKPFMIDLLTESGAILSEFHQWETSQQPDGFALDGDLSVSGLRRILSLLNVEPPDFATAATASTVTKPTSSTKPSSLIKQEMAIKRATKDYAKRVTRMANAVASGAKASNLRGQVLWTDRSGKAIMRLSTRNVQPDVVKLGRHVGYSMLEIVSTFQDADHTARERVSSENPTPYEWRTRLVPYSTYVTPYGRFYRYRPFSTARIHTRENAVRTRTIIGEELTKANNKSKAILSSIESDVMRMNNMVRSSDR